MWWHTVDGSEIGRSPGWGEGILSHYLILFTGFDTSQNSAGFQLIDSIWEWKLMELGAISNPARWAIPWWVTWSTRVWWPTEGIWWNMLTTACTGAGNLGPNQITYQGCLFWWYWTDASEIRRSPVDMENLSLCTGFYTCPDFFHQPEVKKGTENWHGTKMEKIASGLNRLEAHKQHICSLCPSTLILLSAASLHIRNGRMTKSEWFRGWKPSSWMHFFYRVGCKLHTLAPGTLMYFVGRRWQEVVSWMLSFCWAGWSLMMPLVAHVRQHGRCRGNSRNS